MVNNGTTVDDNLCSVDKKTEGTYSLMTGCSYKIFMSGSVTDSPNGTSYTLKPGMHRHQTLTMRVFTSSSPHTLSRCSHHLCTSNSTQKAATLAVLCGLHCDKLHLVAARGGRDAQDGGRHAQVGVLVGVQEAVEVVRLRGRDHARQEALLPLRPGAVHLHLRRLLANGLREAHASACWQGDSDTPVASASASIGHRLTPVEAGVVRLADAKSSVQTPSACSAPRLAGHSTARAS